VRLRRRLTILGTAISIAGPPRPTASSLPSPSDPKDPAVKRLPWIPGGLPAAAALALALASGAAWTADVKLSGASEVPPVETTATGMSTIAVAPDGSVSGMVSTSGLEGTMAHIHSGAAGENGPVIVPLAKGADGSWTVPAGAKLTDEQMKRFKAGGLYVNVHSDAHKGGEIRAQLLP
jgi:hypothetical protein